MSTQGELNLDQLLEDSAYTPLEERLLEDARMPAQMDPARLAAVEAGLVAAMAVPAAEATSTASQLRWLTAGGVAIAGVLAAAALGLRQPEASATTRSAAPPVTAVAPPAHQAPLEEPMEAPPSPVAPAVIDEPEAPAPEARPAVTPPPKPRAPSKDTAVEEARLLAAAQRAYKASDYTAAKRKLDEHARKYPKGKLAESRESVRAAVRCKQEPDAKAKHRAAFEKRYPSSAFMRRVAKACE